VAWTAEQLRHNPENEVTAGIWRFRRVDGATAVCKVLAPPGSRGVPPHWAASSKPQHWNFWRREALAYEHRLVDAWRDRRLDMPALLERVARKDGSIELWLEDVAGEPGTAWPIERYVAFAGALGAGQGCAAAAERPGLEWLSRGFLRGYAGSKPIDERLWDDEEAWAHPLVAPHLAPLREQLWRLHAERDRLYGLIESLPRTLCHLDVWTVNLVARPDGRFVLLDWSFAGDGALGEDAGNLILDAVFDHFVPGERIEELDRGVTDAYLAGVASSWNGDPSLIRLAVCASAVKYHWLGPWMVRVASDEQRDYGGRPTADADEKYRQRALGLAHVCRWAETTRRVGRELGLL
jgi:hypothetical protein